MIESFKLKGTIAINIRANPAINPDDWEVIINHVKNKWRKEAYEPSKLTSTKQFRKDVWIVDRKTTDKSK